MEVATTRMTMKESRSNKEAVLRDFIRFSWKATRGLTSATDAEGRQLVQALAETGRITREQRDVLERSLIWQMEQSRKQFENRVNGAIRTAAMQLREIQDREVSYLTRQIESLEGRLETLLAKKTN